MGHVPATVPPSPLRQALKRVRPVEALYVSWRATPTLRDAAVYSLFRGLAWCIHLLRFSRRLSVLAGSLTRRVRFTFSLRRPTGPPAVLTLPAQPQAAWTLVEVLQNECYRPLLPLSPAAIVDAGANIGLAAVFLHGLFPGARMVCVEPDPANLPLLRRNLEQNGVPHVVVEAALGRGEGRAEFRVHRAASEYSSRGSTVFADREYRRITVATTTLDAVLVAAGMERAELLKIDIEGGEFDVLGGGSAALRRLDYVVGEFHGFAGDVARLAEDLCAASGLTLLKRVGTEDLATLHFGRPPAEAQLPPSTSS